MTDKAKEIMDRLITLEDKCYPNMKYLLRGISIELSRYKAQNTFTIENHYSNAEYKYPNAIDYIPICVNGNLFIDVLLDEVDGSIAIDKFIFIREK